MSKTFTTADVAAHNKPTDLYITVDDDVYDLTQFQDEHPGTLAFSTQAAYLRISHMVCLYGSGPQRASGASPTILYPSMRFLLIYLNG